MLKNYLFFDHASTTKCCPEAAELVNRFNVEDFGNPSSAHAFGTTASKAIRDARIFFAREFGVSEPQVVFTGSGSESDNLALYGIALRELIRKRTPSVRPRVLFSAVEHAAVRKTALSLQELGFDAVPIPVGSDGRVSIAHLDALLTDQTSIVSVMQVNNVTGAIQPVEELAKHVRQKCPSAIFHCDAVQGFGKLPSLTPASGIDLVSISAHKIEGPKGIGALLVLNQGLLAGGIRPLIWGGDQEGGLRSGTPNAGLIAGFHAAAKRFLAQREQNFERLKKLHRYFREQLNHAALLDSRVTWNSPLENVAPHIISLSVPGYPSALVASLLEQRGCLVSMGSACSTGKPEPDPVLLAMGLDSQRLLGAFRVSFSAETSEEDIQTLVSAIHETTETLRNLLGAPTGS